MSPLSIVLTLVTAAGAETPPAPVPDCPAHAAHASGHGDHAAAVDARGDRAMGFSHQATTHHFRLTRTGGVIAVSANDPADAASTEAIRSHLKQVALAFAAGDFTLPGEIHGQVPPGVPVMKQRRAAVRYLFETTALGGQVVITTQDAKAVEAVHAFLRFQIADHRTGDDPSPQP
jgi:hypothetical protein